MEARIQTQTSVVLCAFVVAVGFGLQASEVSAQGTNSGASVWRRADIGELRPKIFGLADKYIEFLSRYKTERLVIEATTERLDKAGFSALRAPLKRAKAGDRYYRVERGKALAAVRVGKRPVSEGVRILGAHIDAVRLDLKQNPLYEDSGAALFQTHYYGGIKNYQWLSLPLALHGVVILQDGEQVDIHIGDDPKDPVFIIPDLLAHLSGSVDDEEGEEVEGERLDPIIASIPSTKGSSSVSEAVLELLSSKYGINEADLRSAELQLVPAGPARHGGLDRSLVIGYGQDDRACGFLAIEALIDKVNPEYTAIVLLVDKEEIGSTGNTGAQSDFLPSVIGELLEAQGPFNEQRLRRAMRASMALSIDVTAAANPHYPDVHDPRNVPILGAGSVLDQSGVHAEFIAHIVKTLEARDVPFQTGIFGAVSHSKSEWGTILPYLSRHGLDAMDFSLPLLSMHAPYEVTSKADLFASYLAYMAFFE